MARSTSASVVQARVIIAVILREMRTRFGRSQLGYLWALAEPIAHVATLLFIFSMLRRASPMGNDLPLFFTTGIVPWLLFSNTASRVMKSVDANGALLSYPHVLPVDLMIARVVLEAATMTVVFTILLGALAVLGSSSMPEGPLTLMAAFACIASFGAGIGMINAAVLTVWPSYDRVYSAITRPLYFLSGIFFTVGAVPAPARDWLLLNPILHMVEWVRSGFFQDHELTHLDPVYAGTAALSVLCLGLALERTARARMRQA